MFFIASFTLRKMILTGHESPFTWVTLITKCSFIRKVAEIQPKLDKWQNRSKTSFYWVFELKQRFISESHLEKKSYLIFIFGHIYHVWLEKKLNLGIWTEKNLIFRWADSMLISSSRGKLRNLAPNLGILIITLT